MLATLGGILALLGGLAVLLVPLLVPELSRPRDAFWGALVLLLGLVLVTSAERLSGAPMLAVLCGGLLIGRLGSEVSLGRWRQLSDEEQQRFWAPERWNTSLSQLGGSAASLLSALLAGLAGGAGWLRHRAAAPGKPVTKRWVRPEPAEPEEREEREEREENQAEPETTTAAQSPMVEVSSFEEVDQVIQEVLAAPTPAATDTAGDPPADTGSPGPQTAPS